MVKEKCTSKKECESPVLSQEKKLYNIAELGLASVDMKTQAIYTKVRLSCKVEGMSKRKASRDYGIHRSTVDKILQRSKAPRYRRSIISYSVLLEIYRVFIIDIMKSDKEVHYKQRHSAKRIYDRMVEELCYAGSYESVKKYVASQKEKVNPKEMFIPLEHPLGEAQGDFGHCKVKIKGKIEKGYFLVIKLSNSDDTFVSIYPAENLVTWSEGHVRAFEYFGCVPKQIVYDNSSCLVKKILFNGGRELTKGFLELQSHYLFKTVFCAPARGNEKGKVEGGVKYTRSNYLTPIPDYETWEELNNYLLQKCLQRRNQKQSKKKETIGESFNKEKPYLLKLPLDKYESYEIRFGKVNSLSLVNYRRNEYSVPTEYGHTQILIKGYHDKVVISYKDKVIAIHKRLYTKEDASYNALHYLDLIERKIRSLDQAKPLKEWKLPEEFDKLRHILESRDGKVGKRDYVKVLKLIGKYNMNKVLQGIKAAMDYGCISCDGIVMCIRQIDQIPITNLEEVEVSDIEVPKADLSEYMELGGL